MKINGWFTPSTVKVVVVAIFLMGAWVTSIQADITALDTNKAEKIDVATQVATQTEVLKSINKSLETMATSLGNLDERQRKTELEIATLKAKADDE